MGPRLREGDHHRGLPRPQRLCPAREYGGRARRGLIHGGVFGGAGQDTNPRKFVQQTGAVVVTVNYRLGPLGYPPTSPNCVPRTPTAPETYGLLDQQAALRWVRSNIGHFGGDARNVTIAGQSAGGSSVSRPACTHPLPRACSPSGDHESRSCGLQRRPPPVRRRAGPSSRRSAAPPLPDVSRLSSARQASATAIVAAQLEGPPSARVPRRHRLPDRPGTAVTTGAFTRVPAKRGPDQQRTRPSTASSPELSTTPAHR
ncbi:carboxylesterase family protein [Streptomyces sp. L7]